MKKYALTFSVALLLGLTQHSSAIAIKQGISQLSKRMQKVESLTDPSYNTDVVETEENLNSSDQDGNISGNDDDYAGSIFDENQSNSYYDESKTYIGNGTQSVFDSIVNASDEDESEEMPDPVEQEDEDFSDPHEGLVDLSGRHSLA